MIMMSLIKRHIRLYIRDKWSVFFSFLSVLIILGLFMLFLQNALTAPQNIDAGQFEYMINSWLMAGVLMVSTVTVPLGFLNLMVVDLERKTVNDFYVSPIKRVVIVLSYLIAAIIIGSIFSVFNLMIGQAYLYLKFGELLSFRSLMQVLGIILLSTTLFSSLFFYVVSFLKTSQSVGTLQTLIGTLIGFLAGLYVPIGALQSKIIINIMSALPTMQVASLFRTIYMKEALDNTFGPHQEVRNSIELFIGVRIELFDTAIGFYMVLGIILVWIGLFTGLSVHRIGKYKIKR